MFIMNNSTLLPRTSEWVLVATQHCMPCTVWLQQASAFSAKLRHVAKSAMSWRAAEDGIIKCTQWPRLIAHYQCKCWCSAPPWLAEFVRCQASAPAKWQNLLESLSTRILHYGLAPRSRRQVAISSCGGNPQS